jgi:site-specific recombinase XerD
MILGQGTATTDEEIIAEYHHWGKEITPAHHWSFTKRLHDAPAVMCKRIGKPILAWTDEDILALYHHRTRATWTVYNAFVAFLLFRGYHHTGIEFLGTLQTDLSCHWRAKLLPIRQKIERTARELGYAANDTPHVLSLLIWALIEAGVPLDEFSREAFEGFRAQYQGWYRQTHHRQHDGHVYRLKQYLIHWGVFPKEQKRGQQAARPIPVRHEPIRRAIVLYLRWCDVKYQPSTCASARAAVVAFFHWFQDQYPACHRLDAVTRTVALSYVEYLKQQVQAGHYSASYRRSLHAYIRQFFDFVIDEQLDTSPNRNPFSVRDLPRNPEMIPRYLTDQELRLILNYCEHEASLFGKTVVITLLHTGIREMELAQLKASDIVQLGGVWKLHIHQGKGLKDRLIPMTPHCRAVLQLWQEQGWERMCDSLFTFHGRPWTTNMPVVTTVHRLGLKVGIPNLTAHRFRHSFAVALLNYGIRESALQKLMGHSTLGMTLEYARILDQTVEQAFAAAVDRMQEGPHRWIPNCFVQEDYTLFVEGDAVSWIRLPLGFCRRNPKLHCESDVKCLLCDRFAIGKEDLPRLQQMYERFMKLGLKIKADVIAAQIQRLELPSGESPQGFIPIQAISTTKKRSEGNTAHAR